MVFYFETDCPSFGFFESNCVLDCSRLFSAHTDYRGYSYNIINFITVLRKITASNTKEKSQHPTQSKNELEFRSFTKLCCKSLGFDYFTLGVFNILYFVHSLFIGNYCTMTHFALHKGSQI